MWGNIMPGRTTITDSGQMIRSEKQLVEWLRRQFEAARYILDGVSNEELVAEYKANHAAKIKRIAQRVADRERLASSQNKVTSRQSILSISYHAAPQFDPLESRYSTTPGSKEHVVTGHGDVRCNARQLKATPL